MAGRNLFRLIKIHWVLMRHGLDEIILNLHFFRPLRRLLILSPFYWFRRHPQSRGERIRYALEDLGPIFVKFGQILSTRRDLLPPDIANALALLQDNVQPFPGEIAVAKIEQAFEQSVHSLFRRFDIKPLASASIAQVHAACTHDGHDVVVKILRPNIGPTIRRDLNVMYAFAQLAERYSSLAKKFKPVAIVAEFEHAIVNELDLMREAANASQLRRNFAGSSQLHIPEIFWDYCHPEVIVMERMYGVSLKDTAMLQRKNVNMKVLAERGVQIFFTQVFKHCFFHADMHPGNIFVNTQDPENPIYIAVDFGIVGTLSPTDQHYLADNMLAFFQRDYRKVAELHVESEWVSAQTRVEDFESAIRTVCEPIFERPLKDISFGMMLLQLFQTARRFDMNIQPQLILLQKTLLNIEGLGRQLYPDLNLWTTAKPFLENWMQERVSLGTLWQQTKMKSPRWLSRLADLPERLLDSLETQPSSHQISETTLNQVTTMLGKLRYAMLACTFIAASLLGFIYADDFGHVKWLFTAGAAISLILACR